MLLRRLLGNNGRWLAGVELGVASIMSHMSESVVFVDGEAAVGDMNDDYFKTKGGSRFWKGGQSDHQKLVASGKA
jgi:hypothetical protein